MNHTSILKITIWCITLVLISFSVSAHNKVVVIPLGDDASGSKKVFVTSSKYTGDLGGPNGADLKCQNEADTYPGSRVRGKIFKALISGGLTDISELSRVINRHDVPYTDVNGMRLGINFTDMVEGLFIDSEEYEEGFPFIVNAAGGVSSGGLVSTTTTFFDFDSTTVTETAIWSGFLNSGLESVNNCSNWSSESTAGSTHCVANTVFSFGIFFDSQCSTNIVVCDKELPLICVEQ